MTVLEKKDRRQDSASKVSSKKAYSKPHLRLYGDCRLLTRTISNMSLNRDAAGGGSIKTQ